MIWQFALSEGNHIILYVCMLAFKNRRCRREVNLSPTQPWCLWAGGLWESLLPAAWSTRAGCIQFIFSQGWFVLRANCWGVNTLNPDCKHLSEVWLVWVFTDQNRFGRRVIKVWQPNKLPRVPHFSHTGIDCDPPFIWEHFSSGI